MWEQPHSELRYDPNYLKSWLYNERCQVTFLKRDGTQRVMVCTLRSDYLPEQTDIEEYVNEAEVLDNPDTVTVWDLEKKSWRRFRFDSVLHFKHLAPFMKDD